MITSVIASLAIAFAEIILRLQNPFRLWKDAFDESKTCVEEPQRGWAPSPHCSFEFHHRYLKGKRRIVQNSLGMRSSREYNAQKDPSTFRILVFGETTLAGWEVEESQTICARLEQSLSKLNPGQRFEVLPLAVRNYSLAQLYTWYRTVFHDFDFDLVIYYFNSNNPRRTITFHESGKPTLFTQPVYLWSQEEQKLGLHPAPPITHANDMAYVNENHEVVLQPGFTAIGVHWWLRNNIHLYCFLDDLWQGPFRPRKFKDRVEIKDIEKRTATNTAMPYQWILCRQILQEWGALLCKKRKPFVILPHLAHYDAGHNWLRSGSSKHIWGFKLDEIPSRKYLPTIASEIGAKFFDNYLHAFNAKVDSSDFYVHPRYAYYTPKGIDYQVAAMIEGIREFLPTSK